MGREIRRVPADWQHPQRSQIYGDYPGNERYHPLFDDDYDTVAQEWVRNFTLFQAGNHPDQDRIHSKYYWEDDPPPSEEYFRSEGYGTQFNSEPTHYQIYETVSEGTPVSPVFETLEELKVWLVRQGYL